MPNAENIRKVIAMLENENHYFSMKRWTALPYMIGDKMYPENVCGTPSCIGGWTEAIMSFEMGLPRDIELGGVSLNAAIGDANIAKWLGITEDQADSLFFPDEDEIIAAYEATRKQAIAHLELIIETGEVDWERFIEKEPV